MNKEMKELAAGSIKIAKAAGAAECRVGIDSERLVDIRYRDRKPENIKEATTKGLFIDIYVNGRYSQQSTSDLRKEALEQFIRNAVATTKLLAEDPFRSLVDPKYYKGRVKKDLDQFDPAYKTLQAQDRHDVAKGIEEGCRGVCGDKFISAECMMYDSRDESFRLTSNGFEGYEESTFFQCGAEVSIQGEGDRRPSGYNYVTALHLKTLPSAIEVGKVAGKRTLALLGGKKLQTETLPIIIENRNVPRLLGGFLTAMFGSNIQQKRSFLADKKGEKIGSDLFTLVDDPFIKGGLGSRLYDGNWISAKKRTMIEKGVLKDFWIDWYYSRKLNWEPTISGPSNLVIPQGNRSVKEIMKDLGRGIFVNGFIGGNSNSTTGDTSVGITGYLFENGVPAQTVAEMNIAGNHLEFWKKVVEVADDPWTYSRWRTPSLVFEDMVVAGV